MSKTFKDSPMPLRKADPSPIFTMEDEGYVVYHPTDMQRQRTADGTLHSMDRASGIRPRGIDLYLSGDKVSKSTSPTAPLDVPAIIKSFMEAEDDKADDLKKTK